jgi:hypothetical protein
MLAPNESSSGRGLTSTMGSESVTSDMVSEAAMTCSVTDKVPEATTTGSRSDRELEAATGVVGSIADNRLGTGLGEIVEIVELSTTIIFELISIEHFNGYLKVRLKSGLTKD